ncbi:hypothetical protein PGB90_010282 [Kerria lacca]
MAWRSHGRSNLDLIKNLKENGIIKSEKVESTMKQVDRANYVVTDPYIDAPQSIGYGVTISAPHMHAYALELLKDKLVNGEKALDVGSGSGYLTVCMSLMIGSEGLTIGVDHIPELVNKSIKNVEKDKPELLSTKQLQFIVGDGREGYAKEAPFNAIHVGAASPSLPEQLISQLKPGGRLIVPIGPARGNQYLEQIDKNSDGTLQRKRLVGVAYVPLTDKSKQLPGWFT